MSIVVALPTEDRVRAHAFATEGLGLEAVGPVADDGVPEPLQLVLGPGVHLMLIPTGGFGWVTAGRATAERGTAEVLLSLGVGTPEEVDTRVARAVAAGGELLEGPTKKPWAYTATLADPDGHLWAIEADPAQAAPG